METRKCWFTVCAAAACCAALLTDGGEAEVVTRRLGTGLPPSRSGGRLPEAWVAPARRAPKIDGRLDDPAWAATRPVLLGKLQSYGEASPRAEARLVHREGLLYVGLKLAEPNTAAIKRTVHEPDGPAYRDDSVELFLSPFPADGYFQLIISASGAIYDRHGHGDPAHWNSGAKAAAAIGEDGWSLEVAVPMSALGVGDAMPARWRANIYRNRQAGGQSESQAFSPTFRGDFDVPERFGHLLFTPTSPWADLEQEVDKQLGIGVEALPDGSSVLRFDLSLVPTGARVYRARLRCEREPMDGLNDDVLTPIEIYPLTAAYQEDSRPQTAGKPLALLGPWYDAFDVTEAVRGWVAGRPGGGVWVKKFPGWRNDRTFLDLMFEAAPGQLPPAVSGVKAFHRSGQTFITWREIEEPVGRDQVTWGEMKAILNDLDRRRQVRYAIYRSAQPITAESLPQAERIAEVAPLSCWNLNGRNIGRPIDRFIATAKVLNWHQWNPFQNATVDGDYGRDCPLDRFVIAEGRAPLSPGTGLYVHTAAKNERAYYAVVTSVDGVENTRELRGGASVTGPVTGPVTESVAEPEPVLQGELPEMPLFNYRQRRLHYVRWVGPPWSNRPCDYFNWSVGLPVELKRTSNRLPLELNLHRDGYSFWRTHYRIEPGSIVLCPHDFPLKTWWVGYHECYGTLRGWSDGTVRNYTEKRLLAFVDWAARKWPVDRNRILVTGCRGGASGSGALHLGLRHPEVFNLVIAGHGEPGYTAAGEQVERIWGKVAWGLKTEHGGNVWEELDLLRMVKALPPGTELPFVAMTYSGQQARADALAEALMADGHAVVTHTAWGGQRMIPVSATATHWCLPLDIRKDRSMLAVHRSGQTGDAVRNGSLLWQTADLVDRPETYAVTLRQGQGEFSGTITVRRLQQFQVQRGRRYAWKLDPAERAAGGGGSGEPPAPQEGTLTVGGDGLVVLGDLKLSPGTYRLTITPSK